MNKVNRPNLYFLIIILFVFQPFIENYIPFFKYYDESLLILFSIGCSLKSSFIMQKKSIGIIMLMFFLIIMGVLGNNISGSNQRAFAIIQDIVSNLKFPLFSLVIYKFELTEKEQVQLENDISFFIRCLFVVMFVCSIVTQFTNIGMSDRVRYGMTSFKFIYRNPAGLNAYYYLFIILFSITLFKNGTLRKNSTLFMLIGITSWVLTLRTRAITFSILYIMIYFYLLYLRDESKKVRFKVKYIVPLLIVVLLLSWDSIDAYFISNDKTARYLLLKTSVEIANEYFPLGTGFGTFGTEASRVYYSSVYLQYGLSSLYGMSKANPMYIVEQFWFGILGQFGYIGFFIYLIIIFVVFKKIWINVKNDIGQQLAAMTLFFTSIFSSITAATFIQSSIMPSIMIFALLRRKK